MTTATSVDAAIVWIAIILSISPWQVLVHPAAIFILDTNNAVSPLAKCWCIQLFLFGYQWCWQVLVHQAAIIKCYYLGTYEAVTLWQVLVHLGCCHKQKISCFLQHLYSHYMRMDNVRSQLDGLLTKLSRPCQICSIEGIWRDRAGPPDSISSPKL